VQSRQLNGAEDSRTWITHQVLLEGGELHMEMGPYANMRAVRDEDLPYSASR
jgi:putative alpha-1,2-mannosidase